MPFSLVPPGRWLPWLLLLAGCARAPATPAGNDPSPHAASAKELHMVSDQSASRLRKATFGSGCFWCTEAVYQELEGVESVVSGYSGGDVENPSYTQVCSGTTGHAEVVQVTYNPEVISYAELLKVFWQTHDPTTPNRQGNDVGPQYRSVVFYHDDDQRQAAEEIKQRLDSSGAFERPIVTEISPLRNFFAAEDYHQDYYLLNGSQPYCTFVIRPKMEKFRKAFADKLKKD